MLCVRYELHFTVHLCEVSIVRHLLFMCISVLILINYNITVFKVITSKFCVCLLLILYV